jgi:hypothetical protein
MLMGTSLKVHSLEQSPLAFHLQKTMNLNQGQSKGKSKGKGKTSVVPKKE